MNTHQKTTKQPETRRGMIVRMMSRKRGASISELAEKTGWKRNSVIGEVSRIRKETGDVESLQSPRRGTVYKIN